MNEGAFATRMGLAGIPNAAESVMVMRDIALSELTGGSGAHRSHQHSESVRAIRGGQGRGVQVTAETAPHYFSLTEAAVGGYNTHAKMNPPLRDRNGPGAICQGFADGTIDAIASDHAPHSMHGKRGGVRARRQRDHRAGNLPARLGLKLVADGSLARCGTGVE